VEPVSLEPDAVIDGRYRLCRPLGEGGMGWVWEAVHVFTNKRFALKFLKRSNEDDRKRFEREVRAAAAIQHPNVIEVHDFIALPDGTLVMVMDLLEGETLGAVIKRVRRIELPELAAIMLPVVSALEATHAVGIVHRDLKPDNIFLARAKGEVVVKVLDFGTAKLMASEGLAAQSTALTSTGAIVGTPYYMSPEQVLSEKDVDARADIWSLGILVYECLSGVRPTEADTLGRVLKRIIVADFEPIEKHCPELPGEVAALVTRMLAADREQRPSSVAEIRAVLESRAAPTIPAFAAPSGGIRVVTAGSTGDVGDGRGDTQRAGAVTVSAVAPSPLARRRVFYMAGMAALVLLGVGGAAYRALETKGSAAVGASSSAPTVPGRHPCDGVASAKGDEKGLATMQLVKAPDGTCFWIDRHEVSVEQYRRFLAERGASTTWADTKRCAWKTKASNPESEDDACRASLAKESEPFLASKPVRCVDWCDAREMCLWAGKDLCGSPNKFFVGSTEPTDLPDEWGIACSPSAEAFPYGLNAEPEKCHVGLCSDNPFEQRCSAARTGTFQACRSTSGAQDMVGNVSEWVFACARVADGGPSTECSHRGGSFLDSLGSASCQGDNRHAPRNTRDRRIGLRCCAKLTVTEQSLVK
jgi:eukaryotic-like serine/threonine-protein kinase